MDKSVTLNGATLTATLAGSLDEGADDFIMAVRLQGSLLKVPHHGHLEALLTKLIQMYADEGVEVMAMWQRHSHLREDQDQVLLYLAMSVSADYCIGIRECGITPVARVVASDDNGWEWGGAFAEPARPLQYISTGGDQRYARTQSQAVPVYLPGNTPDAMVTLYEMNEPSQWWLWNEETETCSPLPTRWAQYLNNEIECHTFS